MIRDTTCSEIERVGLVAVIRADTAPVRRDLMAAASWPPLAKQAALSS